MAQNVTTHHLSDRLYAFGVFLGIDAIETYWSVSVGLWLDMPLHTHSGQYSHRMNG